MRARHCLITAILVLVCASAPLASIEARQAFRQGYDQLAAGRQFPAIISFKQVLQQADYPLLDYAYFYIAEAYRQKERPAEARQVYEIVLKYFPDSILVPRSIFALARVRLAGQDLFGAELSFQELISRYPAHELVPEARFLLGNCLERQAKLTEAARAYRNLDLLHPNSPFAEKALEQLDALAKKTSLAGYEAPAATIYNLGVKHFKAGNYAKAREYFSRLTRFYKKSSFYDDALMMQGRVFLRQNKLPSAVSFFQQAINQNSDAKPEAMFYLALTYDYQKNKPAAAQLLEKLVAGFPGSHSADDALFYLGRYYRELGRPEDALAAYEKLVAAHPNSEFFSDALWLIGNLYFKQQNIQAAYGHFARGFDLPPANASDRLIFWAGKTAARLGEREKAVAAYKLTISRYDHSYYGYRAREELERFGLKVEPHTVPDVSEVVEAIGGDSVETISHEQKYRELLALELGDEAAEEASFLVEKVPAPRKEVAAIAQYHAYVMKGKFAKPIWFADRRIQAAMLAGTLDQLDPRLWRFAYPRGYWGYVEKFAKQYDLDPALVYAVIREESRFQPRALSRASAHGLMQIIPSTGRRISRDLGFSYSRGKMYDPRVNIWMGTYYLSGLVRRFNGNIALALAGYNGGPARVERWAKNYPVFDLDEFVEDIPFRETRNYVKTVIKSFYGYKRTYHDG